jgi:hypothetical protein
MGASIISVTTPDPVSKEKHLALTHHWKIITSNLFLFNQIPVSGG